MNRTRATVVRERRLRLLLGPLEQSLEQGEVFFLRFLQLTVDFLEVGEEATGGRVRLVQRRDHFLCTRNPAQTHLAQHRVIRQLLGFILIVAALTKPLAL